MKRFITEFDKIGNAVQMTGFNISISGFDRVTTKNMDAVERLAQPHEIAEIHDIALPTTAIKILSIWCRRNG